MATSPLHSLQRRQGEPAVTAATSTTAARRAEAQRRAEAALNDENAADRIAERIAQDSHRFSQLQEQQEREGNQLSQPRQHTPQSSRGGNAWQQLDHRPAGSDADYPEQHDKKDGLGSADAQQSRTADHQDSVAILSRHGDAANGSDGPSHRPHSPMESDAQAADAARQRPTLGISSNNSGRDLQPLAPLFLATVGKRRRVFVDGTGVLANRRSGTVVRRTCQLFSMSIPNIHSSLIHPCQRINQPHLMHISLSLIIRFQLFRSIEPAKIDLSAKGRIRNASG